MKNISKFNKFKINEGVDDYSIDDIGDVESLKDDCSYMERKLGELKSFVNEMRFFYPHRPDILDKINNIMDIIHRGGEHEQTLVTNVKKSI